MITFDTYKDVLRAASVGAAHKTESDMVLDATWENSLETRTAYFYDVAHDPDPFRLRDMQSEKTTSKAPISIKFLENSAQTYSKDTVTYHIEFRPGEDFHAIPYESYYREHFEKRWGSECPVGSYVDIYDSKGIFRRWMVVGLANFYNPQQPTYEVLPCNYTFSWVDQGKTYDVAGIIRSQSSYTAGIWQDDVFSTPDDTMKFLLPLTEDTARLSYNHRLVVDTKVDVRNGQEPRVFKITKVDRLDSNGLCMYTIKQDLWNPDTDYINYLDKETYDPASIRGMYCDYIGQISKDGEPGTGLTITCSGRKPELRAGGGYKRLTAHGSNPGKLSGTWSFTMGGADASPHLLLRTPEEDADQAAIEVKVKDDPDLIGKDLLATFKADTGETGDLTLPIIGL